MKAVGALNAICSASGGQIPPEDERSQKTPTWEALGLQPPSCPMPGAPAVPWDQFQSFLWWVTLHPPQSACTLELVGGGGSTEQGSKGGERSGGQEVLLGLFIVVPSAPRLCLAHGSLSEPIP